MGCGPLLSFAGRWPHLAPLLEGGGLCQPTAWRGRISPALRRRPPLPSGHHWCLRLKVHLPFRGGRGTGRSRRGAGRRSRARPAATGRLAILSHADGREAWARRTFVRHSFPGDRRKGGDPARRRSRAQRRCGAQGRGRARRVWRKTGSRYIYSLAGRKILECATNSSSHSRS